MTQMPENTLLIVLAAVFGLAASSAAPVPRTVTDAVVDGNTAFALDLYGQLKAQPGNLFFSPYSISTALAMTYAGARGETETQMAKVLHFPKDQRALRAAFGGLQRQLAEAGKAKGIELNVANALWAQKGHAFLPALLDSAKGDYQANIAQVDFKSRAEAARADINQWVARKTRERIKDILPPGSVDAATRLVLANAIYFKGAWARQFNKSQTSNQPFHLTATRQKDAPLMHQIDRVRYMENTEFQAVELSYKGGELAMVILLPREVEGCGRLEQGLSPALLGNVLEQMKQQRVDLFLPRFTLESGFELNATLVRMGMPDAFAPRADFSGIDGARDLFISGVFHKAWGQVNEEGTEAAAATGVVMKAMAARPEAPPPVFRADHPFIFLIRDTRSGTLLFLGRLSDPGR